MRRCVKSECETVRLLPRLSATHRRVAGEQFGEQKMRLVEIEGDGGIIDLHYTTRFAARRKFWGWRRGEFPVLINILEPEYEVVGRERRAVRPFHSPTQEQRRAFAVLADGPGLGHLG